MLITGIKPEYRITWNANQQEVSERLPLEMFGKLLPGAIGHASIHYQWTNKTTNKIEWAEADGLVIYDNVLLVVEVKGGAFTPTSPTTDFDSHIASIRNLVCKPAIQARRFINELELRGEVEIFDENRKSIGRIRKNDFWRIWGVCVTADDISDVGTRHADFKDVGLSFAENPTWLISLNDLRIFCDLFDSAAIFLHFLEQRFRAYNNPLAHPDDELDFIGMYFEHNDFDMLTKENAGPSHVVWTGYRESIDKYYGELISGGSPRKPAQQDMRGIFAKVISRLDESRKPGTARACCWLLDFGTEGRNQFNALVSNCLALQNTGGRIRPASMLSDDRAVLIFCLTPDFEAPSKIWMREYALALVHSMQGRELLVIEIGFKNGDIAWVNEDILGHGSLSEIEPERLSKLSDQYSQSRLNAVKNARQGKKIGRNEKCPCGSGRKFKACHGGKGG